MKTTTLPSVRRFSRLLRGPTLCLLLLAGVIGSIGSPTPTGAASPPVHTFVNNTKKIPVQVIVNGHLFATVPVTAPPSTCSCPLTSTISIYAHDPSGRYHDSGNHQYTFKATEASSVTINGYSLVISP